MSIVVGFPRLMTEVVRAEKCTMCGTCRAICPVRVIEIEENPKLIGRCIFCDLCYTFCPMVDDAAEEANYKLLKPLFKNEYIGSYRNVYSTRSKLDEVLAVAQDGGFVTSLLIYLVEKRIVDGVILTVVDKEWRPQPIIATTKKQVVEGSGSSYIVSPNLKILHEGVLEKKLEKIAIVGTPCQISAMRKMQLYPQMSGLGSAIYLTIGLFCTESFDYDTLRQYLEKNDIDMGNIKKFAITKGRFLVTATNGKNLLDAPIKDFKSIARHSCHLCGDFTAEYADISVGSVGSPEGWSTVIIRSDKGSKIFSELTKKRLIEFMPLDRSTGKGGIESTIKLSKRKKESAKD